MADIQSNIDINIDASDAISSIKNLQREISAFHQSLRSSGSAANAAISNNMTKNLVNSINATKQFSASLTTVKSSAESFTESLEKNKMSMGQYFKYAAGSTKTFGRLFSDEFNTIQKVAESRVKTLQTQFVKLGREAGGAIKAIKVRPLALDMENLATKTAIAAQKQQLMNQLIKQGSTNLLNFGKNTQWAGRQLMVGFTVPLTMLGSTAAKTFMEMEKSVIKFKRVYGDMGTTLGETDKMISQLKGLAQEFTKYGVAVSDTMEMAAQAAAMGKMGADLTAQVAQATKLAVLGGVEQAQALETTISLTNSFGLAADQLSGKIDFLNAVENQTVTSIEDLTIAIPKAGPVIQQLGGSVEDLTFFLTAMKEGGINASEGANALKSGIASMINPTKKVSEFLAGLGVNLKGIVEANRGDIKGTVVEFAKALDTLDPLNRARAIENLFGKFQFARISTLFQNITKEGTQAQRVLGLTSATSQELAILSQRELKKVEDSPMFKFQKAIEDIKVKLVPLGEAFLKMITPIIEFGTQLIEKFNSMGDGVKNFIMGTIAVLGGLAPAAIMAFGLVANGIANLIKAGNFLRNIFIRAGQGTTILGQQTQYMSSEQLEAAAAAASLDQAHQNLTQQFTAEASAVRRLIAAYNDATAAQARFANVAPITRTRTDGGKGKGKTPGYKDGVLSVPGPKGAGDIVPAMLAPGEAVIPADVVSKNRGFIAQMMSGKLPGFKDGNVSQKGTSLNVGGQQYVLHKPADIETLKQIKLEAERLHSFDPEAAAIAMTMLEDFDDSRGSMLKKFRQKAIMSMSSLNGTDLAQSMNILLPGKENADQNKKARSEFRGNPNKNKSILQEVTEDPRRRKEFLVAARISKAAYEEAISMGMSEEDARNKTEWNPNAGKYGVDRSHKTPAGIFKMLKELWSSIFVTIDPKIENGLLSTLERSPGQAKILQTVMDDMAKSEKDPNVKDSLGRLREKIAKNQAFTEEERRTFSRVIGHLHGNIDRYTEGIPVKDIDNFKSTVRLLDAGYRAAKLESKSKLDYRVKGDDPDKEFRAIKDRSISTLERARDIALAKNRIPQTVKTKTGSIVSYARRVMRLKKGIVSVPGPKGAGDVVPAMLSPGEAVIPAGMSKKYAPLISGMVDGSIPGYNSGLDPFGDPNPFGGSGGMLPPAPGSDPFGSSNYNFDVPEQKKFGQGIAAGFVDKVLPVGKRLATNFGQELKEDGKKIGKKMLSGAVSKFEDVAARGTSKLFGKAGMAINTSSGKTYSNGVEVRTDKNGNEYYVQDGKGRISATEASNYENTATTKEDIKQKKKELRAQRSGRIAQSGMGLSMAVGMATAVPGAVGEAAQKAVGPISAATAAMSLIPGPWGAAAGVIAGVGVAMYQAHEELVAFRKEAQKTAQTMSSGTAAMKTLSEFAGTVSPTEILAKMRAEESSPYNVQTGKNTFGGSYLQSEQGNSMVAAIRKTSILNGKDVAVSDIATQLSQAIQTNVLTKEQAASIAMNLGAELKDHDFSANVLAKITKLVGPGGEDITNKPLEVAAKIIQEKQSSLGKAGESGSVKGLISKDEKGLFTDRANYTEVAAAEAKYAQGYQDIVDMGQQNLDNLELQHRKQIDILTTAGDLAGIEKENKQYQLDKAAIQQSNAKTLKAEYDYLSGLENSGSVNLRASAEQIVDNLENTKEALFDSMDQATKDAAQLAVRNISDDPSLSFGDKATLVAGITVDNIADYQKLQAMFPVKDEPQVWEKIAKVSLKYGPQAQEQLTKLGGFFDDTDAGKKSYELFIDYVTNNEDGQAVMDSLTEISRVSKDLLGHPLVMSEFIDAKGNPTAKLKEVQTGIKKVDDAIKKNKGKAIKYSFETTGFQLTKAQADYFNSLPADQQKTYTTTYLTVSKSITDGDIAAWRKAKNLEGGTMANFAAGLTDEQVIDQISGQAAWQATQKLTDGDVKNPDDTVTDPAGGGSANPLDDLLSRLKQIRQAAVNASGGMKELSKWMKAGALERKGGGLVFSGMNQQLDNKGYNKDFIDFITNAEAKVRKTYLSISKTGVVTLTKEGEKLQNLFNALKLGEYQQSVASMISSTKQELSARKELLATGMSYNDAVEAGRDSGLAEAIAAIKASTNIKDKNAAIKQTIELYKQAKAAAESVKTAEEKFAEEFDKISKKFEADKNAISLKFEVDTSASKKVVTQAQSEIEAIRYQLDDYNAGLTRLQPLEDDINKKYEDRQDALDKIRDLNQKIADQQRGQLDLADALSKGDISAAAKAAQEMRSKSASDALDIQSKNLDMAKEQELKALRVSVNGVLLSREDIEKNIKKLEMEIFEIEESRLEPAQRQIDLAAEVRDKAIAALDDQKREWDLLRNQIDLAKYAALDYAGALKAAQGLANQAVIDNTKPKVQDPVPVKKLIDTLTPAQQAAVNNVLAPSILNAPVGDTTAGGSLLSAIATQIGNGNKSVVDAFVTSKKEDPKPTEEPKLTNAPSALSGLPKSVLQSMGYYASGGFAKGTDTIPAMLTPGEFVVKKYAVDNFGVDKLKAINNGTYDGNSVYNYNLSVNLNGSNMDATDVADTVIARIRQVDSQKIRGNRF